MKRTLTILALMAMTGPALAQPPLPERNPLRIEQIDPFADYYERRPKFPRDILVCYEDETPGADCNCVGPSEDDCRIIPWTDCDTDADCRIKEQSPYGFNPR